MIYIFLVVACKRSLLITIYDFLHSQLDKSYDSTNTFVCCDFKTALHQGHSVDIFGIVIDKREDTTCILTSRTGLDVPHPIKFYTIGNYRIDVSSMILPGELNHLRLTDCSNCSPLYLYVGKRLYCYKFSL